MSLVIDCSIALAWAATSQATPLTARVQAEVIEHGALVPFVFPIEIGNSLVVLERRRKLTPAQVDTALEGLGKLELTVDTEIAEVAARVLLPIARRFHLTLYDAAYLDLALRSELPLATRDQALVKAVKKAGATLFGA
jgi:predicted nucleic acid-binding protein